jgi:anti-sigma B factor antagonist
VDDLSDRAPLEVSVSDTGTGPVIKAAGELDASNIHSLRSVLETHLDSPAPALVLEFADVTFMDTSAIALLIQTSKKKSVKILNPSGPVRAVIEMTGLDGVLVMEP